MSQRMSSAAALGVFLFAGCSDYVPFELPKPGPGVAYTYPADGQWDVPTGARIVVSLTHSVNQAAVTAGCDADGNGAFCVVGPDGPVLATPQIAGLGDNVIHFDADLTPGVEYRVYARPNAIELDAGQQAENLPVDEPLFRFHTRRETTIAGAPPIPLTLNGDDPDAFTVDASATPAHPTLDFSSFRVLFSEPLDTTTVIQGQTVAFVHVGGDGQETLVAGRLIAQGPHLTFDPYDDLTPGERYRLRLDGQILDMGGEPLGDALTYEFTPANTRTPEGTLIEQVLDAHPADGDQGFPGEDSIAGAVPNAIGLSYPMVGDNTIFLKDGSVASHMGDPTGYGGPIPLTIRTGQGLSTTGLDLALGGVIPAGLSTGDLQVSFISDASGWLTRNPYRDPALNPDDDGAPMFVTLTFDVAVSASDPVGNSVLNQTIMNVQATGAARIVDKALAIEVAGTMEMDLLGVARAPSHMVMRLQTNLEARVPEDTTPADLLAAYPASGSDAFPVTDNIVLTFSEPIDIRRLSADGLLTRDADGQVVDIATTVAGSSLILTPQTPLDHGEAYTVTLRRDVDDLWGNAWEPSPTDPTGGDSTISFRTPALSPDLPGPPLIAALYPGVPCALEGATEDSPGRCVGGMPTDALYRPFTLPMNRAIEGYFNQAVQPDSVIIGPVCSTGSVRVEEYDDSGACLGTVPGSLIVEERRFQFVPNQPWDPARRYRLSVIGGANTVCDIGEVCGRNDQPLNTNPIVSMATGGGPDIVIPFVGAPIPETTYLPATIAAPSDVNGNGYLDATEVPRAGNSAGSMITDFGGIVDSASLDTEDCDDALDGVQSCIFVSGTLPVDIGSAHSDCDIGGDIVPWCIPSVVYPQAMLGTSVVMDAVATMGTPSFTITMDNVPTGHILMRVRDNPDGPVLGYLLPGDDGPLFQATLDLYMDAPDMPIANFNLDHDLRSKPVSVTVAGPVTFSNDGRINIAAGNINPIVLQVMLTHTTLKDTEGFVTMEIPAQAMKMTLSSRPRQAALLRERLQ